MEVYTMLQECAVEKCNMAREVRKVIPELRTEKTVGIIWVQERCVCPRQREEHGKRRRKARQRKEAGETWGVEQVV